MRRRSAGCLGIFALAALGCRGNGPAATPGTAADGGTRDTAAAASPTPEGFLTDRVQSPSPLRRLTRAEYRNLVREVFGVEPPSAYALPDDSLATGFAGTANQLTTIAAANRYLDAAVETGERLEPTIRQLMPCGATDDAGERACIDGWLGAFGPRLFRRPMSAEERARYVAAFARARANAKESYERSASLVVQALLVAPELLFVELPSGGAPGSKRDLNGWQMASRLSLLLWDAIPDEALLAAAARGELTTRATLTTQVDRMLRDPRARLAVRAFFEGWLGLSKIESVGNDINVFPFVQRDVAAALADETRAYLDDAFWEQDDFRKLFVSTSRFRTPLLSEVYGDTLSTADGMARYEAAVSEDSFGLFSQRGFMMMLSKSEESAPIHRGAFVRRKLLCGRLPPPPPGLATPLPARTPGVSTRRRISEHTAGARCSGCHGTFNSLGFALEDFNIAGRFREVDEGGLQIDSHVTFDEPGLHGAVDGARGLSEALAASATARACLAAQLVTFAFEREPTTADQPWFDQLLRTFEASGFSMKTVLVELILSEHFRTRIQPAGSL